VIALIFEARKVLALSTIALPVLSGAATKSLELYYAQLGLNLLWTPLFFAFHRKGLALVDILALTGTAAWWTKSLFDLGPVAFGNYNINPGWLGVPYLMWLTTGEYDRRQFMIQ
jgi:benzodiazapine receptor